ncbi:MAG: sulfotransferase family 2 domain-containing protein [Pseudomonadota bacterium]
MYTSRQLKSMARYHLGLSKHLYIHIPKTAGMAVRNSREMRRKVVFADPYFHKSKAYVAELTRVMEEHGNDPGYKHARLIDVHPSVRAKLQPVAVIRNPFARTFSRFTFGQKYQEKRGEEVDYSPAAFAEFLEQRHEYLGRPYFWHRPIAGWYNQADYVRDESGEVVCDILRQEHLGDDIKRYFGVTDLPLRNRSGKKAAHYREVYTPETRDIVAEIYADDIETFGFDFEGPATRLTYFD